jgi:hypothetical protein
MHDMQLEGAWRYHRIPRRAIRKTAAVFVIVTAYGASASAQPSATTAAEAEAAIAASAPHNTPPSHPELLGPRHGGSFAPNQVNLMKSVLSDIAENVVYSSYRPAPCRASFAPRDSCISRTCKKNVLSSNKSAVAPSSSKRAPGARFRPPPNSSSSAEARH